MFMTMFSDFTSCSTPNSFIFALNLVVDEWVANEETSSNGNISACVNSSTVLFSFVSSIVCASLSFIRFCSTFTHRIHLHVSCARISFSP